MGKDEEPVVKTNVEALIREQKRLLESVQKQLINHRKESSDRRTVSNYKNRLNALEGYAAKFWANHEKIIVEVDDASMYIQTALYDQFEEASIESKSKIEDSFRRTHPDEFKVKIQSNQTPAPDQQLQHLPTATPSIASSQCFRLPKLNLPTFSGECLQWPSFYDAFQTIHRDANLSNSQKMQYLKGVLTGPAELLVRHLDITDANYVLAIDELNATYNVKRMIFMEELNNYFKQPQVENENQTEIQNLMSVSRATMHGLTKLGATLEAVFVHMALQKLPAETRTFCLQCFDAKEIPKWAELEKSVQIRLNSLPFNEPTDTSSANVNKNISRDTKQKVKLNRSLHLTKASTCPQCDGSHHLRKCPVFLQLSINDRRKAASTYKLCFNCMGNGHLVNQCSSKQNCFTCGSRHHSLLHLPELHNTSQGIVLNQPNQQQPTPSNHHVTNAETNIQVLLATAVIKIRDRNGQAITVRALLDQGSQVSLITEAAVQRLGLPKTSIRAQITGVGTASVNQTQHSTRIVIGSMYDNHFEITTEAMVLKRLTNYLPSQQVLTNNWEHIKNLNLADPDFATPNHIDVLLGADVYSDLLKPGLIQGGSGTPTAQNTILGWILSGRIMQNHAALIQVVSHHAQVEVDTLLRKFWELEEVPAERISSNEDQWCETFFQQTHKRQKNGKYLVKLPLKSYYDPEAVLGSSKRQAEQRFYHLERRFLRDPVLHRDYAAVIHEYLELGQMEVENSKESNHLIETSNSYTCCYLPHHPVVKESSSTTKLRVVFDASAKTSNKRSLNDVLVTGPVLQNELIQVLINWRFYKYVFTTDIEKMYRRIDMDQKDTNFQRILWRDHPTTPLATYRLNTVTFGTASAPYTAIRVIHQLAEDEDHNFPVAAETMRREMYVDDILSGADNLEDANVKQQQLIKCLQKAGFELRKWSSNCQALLENIPPEHREGKINFELKADTCIKALGLYWNPIEDSFNYQINFKIETSNFTKRKVLSTIARLFDPLGWLNPLIISAKIFMKQLWCEGLDWDDVLPQKLAAIWSEYITKLTNISAIKIPRWLAFEKTSQTYEFHTFCDGSLKAYSAALYVRIQNQNGDTTVNLVIAKSKVTPKKILTVPRIELCGAVLAIKLYKYARTTLQKICPEFTSYFWTDSSVVLSWLKGNPERWKTFVCNRIHTILETSNIGQWRHLASADNPADISSRGLCPKGLQESSLWWHGPSWLVFDSSKWPTSIPSYDTQILAKPETKRAYIVQTITTASTQNELLLRYSSYNQLIKVTSWCLRFISNSKAKIREQRQLTPYLTSRDWKVANTCIRRMLQQECFSLELRALSKNQPLPVKSKLIGLNPFLDNSGLLRVGGRLRNSSLQFSEKHPIILPSQHYVTSLYINLCHEICLHGGVQLTLNQIRKTCWILRGRKVVGTQIKGCQICFKTKPIPHTQLMGNLPAVRVKPSRPFSATGVDYAGPINFRVSKGRGSKSYKGYIAVFVCLSTKAIHLEAVSDLTTSAFLAALHRFFARRGLAHDLYSDCGSTFIGANNILQQNLTLTKQLIEKDIIPKLVENEVKWHFIPPFSPHFGGLWEAGVKSMKYHLKRIIPNSTLTFEELTTLLCRIESCLNSRPLCPLSDNTDDTTVLTPGHFLIGDSLLSPPEAPEENLNLTNRWHQLQKITNDFWKSWSKEYLSRLQIRPKWNKATHSLKFGDLVLIKQDNLPPNKWKLGRIMELHEGTDKLVRVVTLKTEDGMVKRPVVKICVLPCSQSHETGQINN